MKYTIITSNENLKIKGSLWLKRIDFTRNFIIWSFPSEEAAKHGASVLHQSGYRFGMIEGELICPQSEMEE